MPSSTLAFNVILLVATQMLMLVYTKRAMKHAALPILLCTMQFTVSAFFALLLILRKNSCNGEKCIQSIKALWIPRRLVLTAVAPLAISWASGFVLFNASASHMSPALVSLVRCMEPLATVALGLTLGMSYSPPVLMTLIPICGGVIVAGWQSSEGHPSVTGISLAMLSNVGFCCRPYLLKKIKAYRTRDGKSIQSMNIFFHVVAIASLFLPFVVVVSEGRIITEAASRITNWKDHCQFFVDLVVASLSFFLYQYIQLVIMSTLNPLSFSVLTPIVKAIVIVTCALCFGEKFGIWSAIGVTVTTGGGYAFTRRVGKAHSKNILPTNITHQA